MQKDSVFLRKYGPMAEDNYERLKIPRHRSGLTPISRLHPHPHPQADTDELMAYQRKKMYGFTSRELHDLDCLTTRDTRPASLTGIHPILDLDRWHTDAARHPERPLYKMDDGSDWVAGNPRIWPKLAPALRFLTRFIEILHEHPWFETVMTGDLHDVPQTRHPAVGSIKDKGVKKEVRQGKRYEYITAAATAASTAQAAQPTPESRRAAIKALKDDMLQRFLDWDVTFTFSHSHEDGQTGEAQKDGQDAYWTPMGDGGPPMIFLAHQAMLPLLRPGLSQAETQMEQYALAILLFHELAHGFQCLRYEPKEDLLAGEMGKEFYYEDEQAIELGYSAENAIFGGVHISVKHRLKVSPEYQHIAIVHRRWPAAMAGTEPHLVRPKMDDITITMPLTLTYIESLFSADYWDDHLRRYGLKMLALPNMPLAASWATNSIDTNPQWYMRIHERPLLDANWGWDLSLENPKGEGAGLFIDRAQSLLQLTADERVAYAEQFRVELLGQYQALAGYRRLLNCRQLLAFDKLKIKRLEADVQELADVLDGEAMASEAALIIVYRAKNKDKNLFEGMYTTESKVALEVLIWLRAFKDAQETLLQDTYKSVQERMLNVYKQLKTLKIGNPLTWLEADTERYVPDHAGQEKVVADTEKALAAGNVDMEPFRKRCEALTSSLLCRRDYHARALFAIGSMKHVDTSQRMDLLSRAQEVAKNTMKQPGSPGDAAEMAQLSSAAANQLDDLEAQKQLLQEQSQTESKTAATTLKCAKRKRRDSDSDTEPSGMLRRIHY
ncbi:hypothetical protein PVAG01_07419 [Phlyctema vagabunda]|uniref:Uncharacterized protein n=1 Tax=Phlyctema vagabunda TaxID=108571 RepID=A0ABR4PCH8_9HELO